VHFDRDTAAQSTCGLILTGTFITFVVPTGPAGVIHIRIIINNICIYVYIYMCVCVYHKDMYFCNCKFNGNIWCSEGAIYVSSDARIEKTD